MTAPTRPSDNPPPLVIDAKQLGQLLGLGLRTIRTMDAAGRLPRPIKLNGHSVRWMHADIVAWLAAGCPSRSCWESLTRTKELKNEHRWDPILELNSRLRGMRKSGTGWVAPCPLHHDTNQSLSVRLGENSGAVIECRDGCNITAILEALRLKPIDLARRTISNPPPEGQYISSIHEPEVTFSTCEAAAKQLHRSYQLSDAAITIHHYSGDFKILRFDFSDGRHRQIRPIHNSPTGWMIGHPEQKLPLYRLAELNPNDIVYVCEGELITDAARSCGINATTSAYGSVFANYSDWTPLRGRRVSILPDEDDGYMVYARTVAQTLKGLDCDVQYVLLPNFEIGGKILEFMYANCK